MSLPTPAAIQPLVNDAVKYVKDKSTVVEVSYVRPNYLRGKAFSEAYPIISVFIASATIFSFVPILCFLCVLGLSLISFTTLAITAVLVSFSAVFFFSCCILFPILIITLGLAAFTTTSLLSCYFLYNFYLIFNAEPSISTALNKFAEFTAATFKKELNGWILIDRSVNPVAVKRDVNIDNEKKVKPEKVESDEEYDGIKVEPVMF